MADKHRQEGSRLGPAGAPVPLDARHPAGHVVFLRPRRRRLDEAPLLVRLRHPHLAAVPHRLGLRRQHDGALLPFREGPGRVVRLSRRISRRGRRTYDVGHNPVGGIMVLVLIFAVLAQAMAGLFAADTDHRHRQRPARQRHRRQVGRSPDGLSQVLDQRAALPGRPCTCWRRIIYLVWKRQNLIGAMFTGRKPLDHVAEAGKPAPTLHLRLGPAGDLAADRGRGHRLLLRTAGLTCRGGLAWAVGPPLG